MSFSRKLSPFSSLVCPLKLRPTHQRPAFPLPFLRSFQYPTNLAFVSAKKFGSCKDRLVDPTPCTPLGRGYPPPVFDPRPLMPLCSPLSCPEIMGRMTVPTWLYLGRARLLRGLPRCDDPEDSVATASPAADLQTLGVMSLEASALLSRVAQLWHSLADDQIALLRDDVFRLEGVQRLVTGDRKFLSSLVLSEMLDALAGASRAAALLGRRCSGPALRALEQLLPDAVMAASADGAPRGWALSGKQMDRKAGKMERLAAATAQLCQEREILAEMERGLRREQANASVASGGRSLIDLAHKVAAQRQAVKALREQSLWDRSHDFLLRLLARALFTIAVRIHSVFGGHGRSRAASATRDLPRSYSDSAIPPRSSPASSSELAARSGPIIGSAGEAGRDLPPLPGGLKSSNRTRWSVSRGPLFRGCSVSGKDFPLLPRRLKPRKEIFDPPKANNNILDSNGKWVCTPSPTTLGASALALRYANIIILIEKLVEYPHLIGPAAKDQLYDMLPASLRAALRAKLKRQDASDPALAVYDPTEWREAVAAILGWLSPLAHGTVSWQSERSFEQQQQQWPPRANVLLLQTLHFADRSKTEAAMVELLVGLNYLCRSANGGVAA